MEESRALPERQDFTRLVIDRKDFPKFTQTVKFGALGTLQIKGQISREEKQEKTVEKSIKITSLDGENFIAEEKEDEPISLNREPVFSIPESSRNEFKDFHYGNSVNLSAGYEVVTVSDDSIVLKLKSLTPKITRRI